MQLAFGLAGAAIGSAFGFASVGWSIGVYLGRMAEGTEDTVLPPREGPRLGDLKVQTSTYGKMLPIAYGTVRIAGNVIWAPPITETPTTQVVSSGGGGKGGGGGSGGSTSQQQTTYSYSADFAVALCEGEIVGIRKVWANGKLIYDVGEDSTAQSILASTTAMTIYTGSETQTADPTMEADHPTLCPAYRGTAYVVFNDLQLEPFGNRLPNLEFEVVCNGEQEYMVPTELYTLPSPSEWSNGTGTGDQPKILRNSTDAQYLWTIQDHAGSPTKALDEVVVYNNFTESEVLRFRSDTGNVTFCGEGYNGRMWYMEHPPGSGQGGPIYAVSLTGQRYGPFLDDFGFSDGDSRFEFVYEFPYESDDPEDEPVWYMQYNNPTANVTQVFRFAEEEDPAGTLVETGVGSGGQTQFLMDADRITGRCYIGASGNTNGTIGYVETNDPSCTYIAIRTYDQSAQPWAMVGVDGYIYSRSVNVNEANVLEKIDPTTGDVIDTVTLTGLDDDTYGTNTKLVQDGAGRLYVQVDRQLWRINYATMEILQTGTLSNSDDWIMTGDTFMGTGVLVLRIESGAPAPNNVVRILADPLTPDPPTLSEVVTDLCERCGLTASDIDVSDLDGSPARTVTGYVISRRASVRSALEPLMATYFFDAVESDNKIKFVPRGGAVAVTIEEDDLAAHTGDPSDLPAQLTVTRKQELELPQQLDFLYMNKAFDYQTSVQSARRQITTSQQTASLSAALVFTDDEAAQIVHAQMYNSWFERESYQFTTSRKYLKYEPTDILAIVKGGVTHAGRIIGKDEGADGVIRWTAVADATHLYTQTSDGVPSDQGSQEILVVGATEPYFLDTALLREVDDTSGWYLAVRGGASGWRGAQLWESADDGATYDPTDAVVYVEAGIGHATTALGDFAEDGENELFDEGNSVTVVVQDDVTLASATRLELFNHANVALLGNEIIQWRTATLTDTNTYVLTGLRRGRLGTESFMGSHAIGDTFIVLDGTLRTVSQPIGKMNQYIPYKAVSFGTTVAQASARTFRNTNRRLKPLSPWHVKAGIADGDWTIEWTRRTRYNAAWVDGADVALGENTERYEIDIFASDGETLLRTLTSSTTSVTYTEEQQTEDAGDIVYSINVVVYQVSDRVGRGYPSATLTPDAGAHRYWRLTNFDMNSTLVDYTEVQLWQGNTNFSVGGCVVTPAAGKVTVSYNIAGVNIGDPPSWMDGLLVGSWNIDTDAATTDGNPAHITLDFDTVALGFPRVTSIFWSGGTQPSRFWTAMTVQFSDDGQNWTTKSNLTGLTFPGEATLVEVPLE